MIETCLHYIFTFCSRNKFDTIFDDLCNSGASLLGNVERKKKVIWSSSVFWRCLSFHSTQAVRITDDCFRHPECYTCTDCGLNLRMRGHFWVGDVMYCEKHAKERYQGPGSSPQATVSPRQWACHSTPAPLCSYRAACLPETPPHLTQL